MRWLAQRRAMMSIALALCLFRPAPERVLTHRSNYLAMFGMMKRKSDTSRFRRGLKVRGSGIITYPDGTTNRKLGSGFMGLYKRKYRDNWIMRSWLGRRLRYRYHRLRLYANRHRTEIVATCVSIVATVAISSIIAIPIGVVGAAITTNAAGNWSVGGTWIGGVPPGAGDTAILNHDVTIDSSITIGSGAGAAAITINGVKCTQAAGTTITLTGHVYMAGGGAEWDSSGTAGNACTIDVQANDDVFVTKSNSADNTFTFSGVAGTNSVLTSAGGVTITNFFAHGDGGAGRDPLYVTMELSLIHI